MQPITIALLTLGVASSCFLSPRLSAQSASTPAPQDLQWKDLTKSGIPLRFYGFFRFDAYYNTARMDSVLIPTRVLPETTKADDNQFAFDTRLTRFGFDVTPVKVHDTAVTGKLEIDFANYPAGVAESRATPRIRLAYLDIAEDEYALRVGQDWDVISPLYPAVNAEMLMWNAGNLGDRRPQMQGRWAPSKKTEIKVALGLTGAVNNEDLDTPTGERDGFDSGMPHLQVRAGTKPFELVEGKPVEIGAWGLYGRTETDTAFNGKHRFSTWVVGVDLQVPLTSSLSLRGEGWTGANLGDVRGGIGQTVNTDLGREISSSGGWAEFVYACSAQTRCHIGASLDDPDNRDLSTTLGNATRSRNRTAYIGTVHDWDSGVRTGFDVIYWETNYTTGGPNGSLGNAVRCDLWFQFNF